MNQREYNLERLSEELAETINGRLLDDVKFVLLVFDTEKAVSFNNAGHSEVVRVARELLEQLEAN
jgi:hypothetical protein